MQSAIKNPPHTILKQEWDYSPHIDDFLREKSRVSENCHVTRMKEQELLMDFFRRRAEGALLISGKRGVGKTSYIISAIIKAYPTLKQQKNGNNKELLCVLVNAPNFEIRKSKLSSDDKSESINFLDFKRLILQNLVRGLYQAAEKHNIIEKFDKLSLHKLSRKVKTSPNRIPSQKISTGLDKTNELLIDEISEDDKLILKNDISNLFNRAKAKQVTEEAKLEQLALEQFRLEKQASFRIGWKLVVGSNAISVCSALTAALTLPLAGISAIWSAVIAIIISLTPPTIAMAWQIKKTATNETKAEQNAKIYYLFDYDLSALQSELEETLRTLTNYNYKVVFVIDELDKMPETDVIEVIKSLKPLFNQASALFVLSSGEEFFNDIIKHDKERGKEYTLFSQKIFVRRPQFEELRKFMDRIVNQEKDPQAVIKLFSWNEIDRTKKLADFLKGTSIDYGDLVDIQEARIVKDSNNIITITFTNVDEKGLPKDYSVLIKNEEIPQDLFLRIPMYNKTYEFYLMKDNDTSYVYTRSRSYRDYQYYAMYASRSDFFDLYNVLRDNIFYSSNDRNPKLKIEINEKQQVQATLQEIMEKVYSKKEYTHLSKWHKNDRLLSLMYEVITKLEDAKGIRIELTPSFKIHFFK